MWKHEWLQVCLGKIANKTQTPKQVEQMKYNENIVYFKKNIWVFIGHNIPSTVHVHNFIVL